MLTLIPYAKVEEERERWPQLDSIAFYFIKITLSLSDRSAVHFILESIHMHGKTRMEISAENYAKTLKGEMLAINLPVTTDS